jgi:hypothetical protein
MHASEKSDEPWGADRTPTPGCDPAAPSAARKPLETGDTTGVRSSRVKEWIERYGDPRDPKVDPIDWVERIPFPETSTDH